MNRQLFSPRFNKRSGFTLVELLVVIGIIAILASVILSAGSLALKAAQRAKAANLATQIQTAALNYYTEYSVYPVTATATAGKDFFISDSNVTDWQNMIWCLTGNLSPSAANTTAAKTSVPANTREIAFLQLRASDVDANDCPKNPISVNSTSDPYFNLGIDNDYSNLVGDTGTPPGLGIPNFSSSTQGSIQYYGASKWPTAGIIVWANCNTTTAPTTWNPGFFIHTY